MGGNCLIRALGGREEGRDIERFVPEFGIAAGESDNYSQGGSSAEWSFLPFGRDPIAHRKGAAEEVRSDAGKRQSSEECRCTTQSSARYLGPVSEVYAG